MSGWMRAAGFLDNLFAGMNCDCQRGEGAVELTEETKKDGTTKRGVLATRHVRGNWDEGENYMRPAVMQTRPVAADHLKQDPATGATGRESPESPERPSLSRGGRVSPSRHPRSQSPEGKVLDGKISKNEGLRAIHELKHYQNMQREAQELLKEVNSQRQSLAQRFAESKHREDKEAMLSKNKELTDARHALIEHSKRVHQLEEIVNKYRAAGVARFDAEHAPAHYHEHFAGDDHLSSRQPDDAIHHHQDHALSPADHATLHAAGLADASAPAWKQAARGRTARAAHGAVHGASGGSQPSSPTGHLAPRVSQGDAWGSGPPGSGGRAARRPEPIVLATTRPGMHIPRAGVAGRAPSPEPLQPGRKQMVYM